MIVGLQEKEVSSVDELLALIGKNTALTSTPTPPRPPQQQRPGAVMLAPPLFFHALCFNFNFSCLSSLWLL